MKKTSLAVALPALALSGLLLSGCGIFRSQKSWETAKQESPLEIPPGLDTPAASEALVVPLPGANQATANGATSRFGLGGGAITDGFVLSDGVGAVYQRVGQALSDGSLGRVTAHDDAAHSYTLEVSATVVAEKKRGLFGRILHGGSAAKEVGPTETRPVTIAVNASGSGSEVRAQGFSGGVIKVVDGLKKHLGVKDAKN